MQLLANIPPFALTDEQFATVDAAGSNDAKTMWLQVYHQAHCYKHRQIVGVYASLDPARFSREWGAREYEHMAEAWGAYYARASHEARRAA